ncbi:hypothetical protein Dimus_038514 [Dionaea muscipula]
MDISAHKHESQKSNSEVLGLTPATLSNYPIQETIILTTTPHKTQHRISERPNKPYQTTNEVKPAIHHHYAHKCPSKRIIVVHQKINECIPRIPPRSGIQDSQNRTQTLLKAQSRWPNTDLANLGPHDRKITYVKQPTHKGKQNHSPEHPIQGENRINTTVPPTNQHRSPTIKNSSIPHPQSCAPTSTLPTAAEPNRCPPFSCETLNKQQH